MSCAIGCLVSFHPLEWVTDPTAALNEVLCRLWSSEAFYILVYTFSVYNHVLFSGERYFALVHPLRYATVRRQRKWAVSAFYLCVLLYSVPGFLKQTYSYSEYVCVNWIGVVEPYDFANVAVGYVIPLCLLVFMNARVVFTLRAQSKSLQNSSAQLGGRDSSFAVRRKK